MDENTDIETLLQQLSLHRKAYLETFQQIEGLFTQQLRLRQPSISEDVIQSLNSTRPMPTSPRPSVTHAASDRTTLRDNGKVEHNRKSSFGLSTLKSSSNSRRTDENSDDDDDDESYYVQDTLLPQNHDYEELRKHLREYRWDIYGAKIMATIIDNQARMQRPDLFPNKISAPGLVEDRSHYTAYQVFDVGSDGAPLLVDTSQTDTQHGRAKAIWHAIKEINPPSKILRAVGRITIIREPSPILFGAIHFTTHKIFDTNELFQYLVEAEASAAHIHRAFEIDPRRQRSFVFSFEYFTIIGDDCVPMKWQVADRQRERKPGHIAITRCSSVVALYLGGKAVRKLKNPSRRTSISHGLAYDPWGPWQVLNIQCYPDWNSSTDTHESSNHYVNGVEAFLVTLLGEYGDAERRFEDIYKTIKHLITPSLDFMFDADLRDKLLFEDGDFTYSRRYFWAYQTLGIIIDSIKALVDTYEDNFTDEVWEGKHKSIWPLVDEGSARNKYFLRKMKSLRSKFTAQIEKLKLLIQDYEARRAEITGLRDQLFSGTSVRESRKSVEMSEITVQQGHNIKLLTLVSIFFLPLTFVTSVFGMTNMPTEQHFWMFAIVTTTVCIPFFVLVGSLNSIRGMHFWRSKSKAAVKAVGHFLAWLAKAIVPRSRSEKVSESNSNAEAELSQEVEYESQPKIGGRRASVMR